MKKIVSVMSCLVLFSAVPMFVYATDVPAKKTEMTGQKMAGKGMEGMGNVKGECMKGGDMRNCCGGKCNCMGKMDGMMMHKTVVATSDGGVVVMMGDKLVKYDKNLNLVKETELKMEEEVMGGKCGSGKHMEEDEDK